MWPLRWPATPVYGHSKTAKPSTQWVGAEVPSSPLKVSHNQETGGFYSHQTNLGLLVMAPLKSCNLHCPRQINEKITG